MPLFLDTRGKSSLGIGICGRCSRKFPLDELMSDPNYPGLRVCKEDLDQFDPWRLPAPPADNLVLDYPRPDTPLYPFTPIPIYADQPLHITQVDPTLTWQANAPYLMGASVTPLNVNDPAVQTPQYQFVCAIPGTSGATPPKWPSHAGVQVVDNGVTWLCLGISLLDGITQAQPIGPNA